MPSSEGGRDESDVAANQGTPRADGHHQKLGWGNERFYPEFRERMALLTGIQGLHLWTALNIWNLELFTYSMHLTIRLSIHPSVHYLYICHASICFFIYPLFVYPSAHSFIAINPSILQIFIGCLLSAGVTVMNKTNRSLPSQNSSLVGKTDIKLTAI